MHISDPASELNDFYGYARRLRAMAAQHVDARERNRLELMVVRVEGEASAFARRYRVHAGLASDV